MVHLRQVTTGLTVLLGLVTLLNLAHCGREGGERVQEGQEFTLTSDHVRLLRHLRVVWSMVEAGGPVIDIERPFGSTQIQRDVNHILGHRGGWLQNLTRGWVSGGRLPAGVLTAAGVLVDAGKLQTGSYTIINGMRERLAAGGNIEGVAVYEASKYPYQAAPEIPATPTFRFEVTADHLKLFARARFKDRGFNVKRPYGDMTYYELDMADALGVKLPERTGNEGVSGKVYVADVSADFTPEEIARFDRLHGEMLFTFQAFLQYAQLEPGVYVLRDYVWTPKEGPTHP